MSPRLASCLLMLAVGCGGPSLDSDGGRRLDSGRDTGTAEPCTRDRDCGDTNLYCSHWRCRPGEPGTDPRGCIDEGSPCAAGEICDETEDGCLASDWCTEGRVGCRSAGDCDGDGSRAGECGGNDCDDDDDTRYPDAVEVCDSHDNDCVVTTLGPDGDDDGFIGSDCCDDSGAEPVCGTDCDDTRREVRPGATEVCDGVDNDCNGRIDDTFECPQNASVDGTNTCGHMGVRACSSACTWADSDFFTSEAAATCDYCPDAAEAWAAGEHAVATGTVVLDLVATGRAIEHATCVSMAGGACAGWRLTSVTGGSFSDRERGALWTNAPVRVGHGPLSIRADVVAEAGADDPQLGWGISVLLGDVTVLASGGYDGAPSGFRGWSASWMFSAGVGAPGPDQWRLRYLTPGGGLDLDPIVTGNVRQDLDGPTGSVVAQWQEFWLQPDDPDTPEDETAVTLAAPVMFTPMDYLRCANNGAPLGLPPCGYTVRPGDLLTLGVTAGGLWPEFGSGVRLDSARVTVEGTCP